MAKISNKLSNVIKNEKPDIVFFNQLPSTMWAQNYGNIPIFCFPQDINLLYTNTYINNLPLGKRSLWRVLRLFVRFYDKKKWNHFDQVICHTKFTAKNISKTYNIDPKIIYLETDTKVFSPKNSIKKRAILSMGDTWIRRADLLIKAANQLRKKRNDFSIWIVGNHGEHGKELQNLVKKYDLSDIVEFFGRVSDSKLAALYSESLVVVHLVKDTPFGLIVTEAMACETPVIALKPGGTEETIIHEETGFLINENSDLIEYMEKFLDKPELSLIMGKKGRIRVQKYFEMSKQNEEVRELMQEWIHKKSNF